MIIEIETKFFTMFHEMYNESQPIHEEIVDYAAMIHQSDLRNLNYNHCSKSNGILSVASDFAKYRFNQYLHRLEQDIQAEIIRELSTELFRLRSTLNIHDHDIFTVIRVGTIEKLHQFLDLFPESIDIVSPTTTYTPLYQAVVCQEHEMVTLLLNRGSKHVDTEIIEGLLFQNPIPMTPLMKASCQMDLHDMIVALMEGGARTIDKFNLDGESPFGLIVVEGEIRTLEYVIRKNPDSLNQVDDCGNTPLHWAAERAYPDVLSVLIREGSNLIDTLNDQNLTPLGFMLRDSSDVVSREKEIPNQIWTGVEFFRAMGTNTSLIIPELIEAEKLIEETFEFLSRPISEERMSQLRFGVYFERSLLSQLLRAIY